MNPFQERLEQLIRSLIVAMAERNSLLGLPEQAPPNPPAADVSQLEARLGRALPPSYRSFLELHDGWEKFNNVFTLIGASAEHSEGPLSDIKQTLDSYREAWEAQHGPATPEAIKAFEAALPVEDGTEDGARLYLGTKLHFGTDFAGSLIFFNEGHMGPDGEMEVIYRNQNHRIVARYSGLETMFEAFLKMVTSRVAKLKASS